MIISILPTHTHARHFYDELITWLHDNKSHNAHRELRAFFYFNNTKNLLTFCAQLKEEGRKVNPGADVCMHSNQFNIFVGGGVVCCFNIIKYEKTLACSLSSEPTQNGKNRKTIGLPKGASTLMNFFFVFIVCCFITSFFFVVVLWKRRGGQFR